MLPLLGIGSCESKVAGRTNAWARMAQTPERPRGGQRSNHYLVNRRIHRGGQWLKSDLTTRSSIARHAPDRPPRRQLGQDRVIPESGSIGQSEKPHGRRGHSGAMKDSRLGAAIAELSVVLNG